MGRIKARRVVAAATDWALRNGGLEQPFRFDVVAVTFGEAETPHRRSSGTPSTPMAGPGHW